MYLRQQAAAPMQQQPIVYNPPYQPGPQHLMMTSQAANMPINHSWVNPNSALSMDAVTVNPSGAMFQRPINSRQQQPNPGSCYSHREEQSSCEGSSLPLLSMRDLQCLDTVPQGPAMNQSHMQPDSQTLFHLQRQIEQLPSELHIQNHQGSQSQGLQTEWPSFSSPNTGQSIFNGAAAGDGGGTLGLNSFALLEGMESVMVGGSQTGFRQKQESQITVVHESHVSLMQLPTESQGSTYTNLVPRSMSNGTNIDAMRQEASGAQPLKNLQNPFSNSNNQQGHFATLADYIKANRHTDFKE